MAFELHRIPGLPGLSASAISVGLPLGLDTGDVQRQFVPLTLSTQEPIGVAQASVVTPGDSVAVYDAGHIVNVTAGASLGHGADIGIGSTNGALAPIAAASGVTKWAIGKSLTAALVGEQFSLYIRPRQLSNLA